MSNAIFDERTQFGTPALAFFDNQGFFTLRFMPSGIELGHNLTNAGNTTKEVGAIARYKAGIELGLLYKAKTSDAHIQRVELDAQAIYHRLFDNEVAYNATTKTNVNTTRGGKLWTQVDFKVMVGPKIGNIQAGFKLTYERGYLPPVFAETKVFSYGIVFESDDKPK